MGLNGAQTNAPLQQLGGKGVTQGMRMDVFAYPTVFRHDFNGFLHAAFIHQHA
jgi:hypothetical protein